MSDLTATTHITPSQSIREACDLFTQDIRQWAMACAERYRDTPPTDGHDQLTYTTGWEPWLTQEANPDILDFLCTARDACADHFTRKDLWHHGYWRTQEAHHGTEHYELFLGFLSRVCPDDPETTRQVVDAAEHLGNWEASIPEWYDPTTGLFRSLYFGTDGVEDDPAQLNMPDHIRCATILYLTYGLTHDPKYLDVASAYAAQWARAITSSDASLPIALTRDGVMLELLTEQEEHYRAFAGMAGQLTTNLDRAENLMASGAVQLFLGLWKETANRLFVDAARRLLRELAPSLSDPDAGAVSDLIRLYRRMTGSTEFDEAILQAVRAVSTTELHTLTLEIPALHYKTRPNGIGKRTDMLRWLENDQPRTLNPVLLSVAAEVRQDPELATQAVDLARAYFHLAREVLPDGRDHGCSARSVSAVARGHGRDNHTGMTTGVLQPLLTMEW